MNPLNNSLLAPQGSLYGGYAQQIAERTMRLLIQQDLVVPGTTNAPVFYSWPRPDRLVLVFDPMRLKNIEAVLSKRFAHSLSSSLNGRRIATTNTHGTGCSLSSAIAAFLAHGVALEEAVAKAKTYLTAALQSADQLKIGHGHGPIHHFHAVWDR